MMGVSRVGLLLLLSGLALAQQANENEPSSPCQLVSRFKTYRKYLYLYSTENRNGVVGSNLTNGPKVTCKVEIEVPQACRFIMSTTDCAVSEVSGMDPQGEPVYAPAPGSDAFKAAMEKNPLKFTVENALDVDLFPMEDEPTNIANIKRGIVSTLLSPSTEETNSMMNTVHGPCRTNHQVNAANDVTITRDLSQCHLFYGRDLISSPVELPTIVQDLLINQITSSQECNYQFDNKGKHITSVSCTEKHVYLPIKNDNGISSVITQELNFQNSKRINNRVFDLANSQHQYLYVGKPDDKSSIQTKDDIVNIMSELLALPGTDQAHKRTSLFHKLVSTMRALQNETLSQTVTELMDMSPWVTWQTLLQCGTPECNSAILQSIWKIDGVATEVDALVYPLGLVQHPTGAHLRDMLSTAQYKQSKAIMYALAHTVKNFYRGNITPEIRDVAVFMEEMLNECSGELGPNMDPEQIRNPQELSYLVLRVIGVMGQPMQDYGPSVTAAVLRCAKKTDAPLMTQKAAIQAFRNIIINDEVRAALMEIYQDAQSPVEKRVAAYLILIKNMDEATAKAIVGTVEDITDEELKKFVVTHLNNVLKSDLHATYYIKLAVRDKELPPLDELSGKSRSFMNEINGASVKTNFVFDDANTLPKDVSLDVSMDKDYTNNKLFKVNFEGEGFEPAFEALLGEKGFVADSFFKLTNWGLDKAQTLKELLSSSDSDDGRVKRQVPDDLIKGVAAGFQKLMDGLRSSQTPEAVAYLEFFGSEIGYMKISQIRDILENLLMYQRILLHILPTKALSQLADSTDNQVFAHYIFVENGFSFPTISGLPLKFTFAGVLAPGAKGGLAFSPNMGALSFMPSVGVEFITNMGVHLPDFVESGVELHTNIFHESSFNAKVSWDRNQVKLTLPTPAANTQLFSISNTVLSVSAGQTSVVPSMITTDSTECQPLITGLNLCTVTRHADTGSAHNTPYFPLTKEGRFAVEIQPTGEVSEYTVSLTRKMLKDGKDRITDVKLSVKAEGVESSDITASLKYNHMKNTVSTEFNIPDYDIEAGIKFALMGNNQGSPGMRGITIDVTNKNIPQLSLMARTRLEMMKEALLQLQMTLPTLKSDASVTMTLNNDDILILDVETAMNFPETLYQHKVSVKYDDDKIELELKTDANSDIQKLIPNAEDHHRQLQNLLDDMLDQRVPKTDMKLRHIVTKGLEAVNIWMDKLTAQFPYLENLRTKRSITDLTLPSLPEKLFFQYDGLFRYQFNKDWLPLSLPLPLGGKTSQELDFPEELASPEIVLPKIGLRIPPLNLKLPPFTLPPTLDFSLPLLGLAEASAKINSNIYSWEGSVSGGNDTTDVPNFIAHYKFMAQSPFCLLSYKLEGTGMIVGNADDSLKYLLSNTFNHCLIDTSFSVVETLRVTDKLNAKADYKIAIASPLGFETTWFYTAQATSTPDQDEVSGDGTLDAKIKIGTHACDVTYMQNYNMRPVDREGRGESSFVFTCPQVKVQNIIQGIYMNSELSIISKTNAFDDILKHVAELKFKDGQLTLKCMLIHPIGKGITLNNKVMIGVSDQMALNFQVESQIEDTETRLYSIVSAALNLNGLEVNSEGSLTFDFARGLHKASLIINKNGLTTSGTNTVQCAPVTIENIYNCVIHSNGAVCSTKTKVTGDEGRGELNIDGQVTSYEATIQGVLKGHAFDGTTRNNVNVVLNRNGLTFTSETMGSINQLKTENSHQLTVTLWTVNLRSKSNNFICDDVYYKQDAKVNMQPFVTSIDVTNDLKLYEFSLNNEGHLKLRPTNIDLRGNVMAAFGEDNFKHIYEINFGGSEGALKYATSANGMDAQLSHNCDFEFAGLSSTTKCESRINSQPLRLDSTLKVMALPFSLSIDGVVNSDGEIQLHGKHSGQLYSRFLFKGEPLSLTFTHDERLSTTHKPKQSEEITTNLDSKLEGLLMPNNQFLNWKMKSKLNNHAYSQDFSTYNNPEKIGAEFAGVVLTDILSKLTKASPTEEEFSMSGFLKYDKNADCHIIELPFIESFPVAFEHVKMTLVQALESLYKFIDGLDINLIIADLKTQLEEVPKKVGDFMREFDLENKVALVKDKMEYLLQEFSVTLEDLEKAMMNFKMNLEETVTDIAAKIKDFLVTLKDYVESGELANKISNALQEIGEHLWDLDERYEIKLSLMKLLEAIEDILSQIDLQKLNEASTEWLKNLDAEYGIMEKIRDSLSEVKQTVENVDIKNLFEDLKDYILSFDLPLFIEQLQYTIPYSDIKRVIENMNDVVVNWIDEYEIPQKLNAVYMYIKDQILKYNLDEKCKDLMDQVVTLIEDFKIEETLQTVVDTIKNINFDYAYNVMMEFFENLSNTLKEMDFKKLIDDLNDNMTAFVIYLKEFDYHMVVDETNEKIQELANYINEQIKMYKIVEKIEAVREFLREIQNSVYSYLDGLKNTKVADALTKLKNVIDSTFLNDVKLKALDVLDDIRERISNMDVIDEITVYLKRASEFYTNTVDLISMKLTELIALIADQFKESEIIDKIKTTIENALNTIKDAEIKVPMFTVPFTDLVIPDLSFNLNKLPEINIPTQITIPEITILNTYTIPSYTIDFEEIKGKIIEFIDNLKMFEIQWPDPNDIFGELKVLYLFDLPDFTFPEIALSEIKVPAITVPKMNLEAFEILMLPIPPVKLPKIPSEFCIPVFGKLSGDFRFNSPQYSFTTTGNIENATSALKNPLFTASLNSQAISVFKPLEFNFEVDARLEAPRMQKMIFAETVKATHMAFLIDHEGRLTLTSSSVEATARTIAKATTPVYTADLVNNIMFALKGGITATCETSYDHNLDLPSVDFSSQCSAKHITASTLELGKVSTNGETNGNCKWSYGDYADEGTHKNKLDFTIDLSTAKLTYNADTDSKSFKSRESLMVESVVLDNASVAFRCEMDVPSLKKSVSSFDVQANIGDLKLVVTATHDCEYTGNIKGTELSTLDFKVQPFEINLDAKNKANLKIALPLKLTGKMDFQNDYCLILNSEKQKACWLALGRFNQYKYNHNIVTENNDKEIYFHKMMNTEANLDFLTVPLSIPEMTIPYFEKTTPAITDFSLWDHTGLKYLLHSPQQSFDINLKLHYFKNPDTHSFELNLEPFYNAISDNANAFNEQFETMRDKIVELLKESHSQVKKRYIKHKKDTSSLPPKIITIPGYKIPIVNIEVSSFTAELPAFSFVVPKEISTPSFKVPALGFSVPSYTLVLPSVALPNIQVPEMIGNLQLPTFTLPDMQNNVLIPTLGNLTLDFSYKSTVITVSANGGVFNQSDIVARFTAGSASVWETLNGKLDGTTSLTMKRGIKLAASLTLEHPNVQGNHECAISLSKKSIGTSFINNLKVSMPFLNLEFDQAIEGNSQTTPTASAKNKLKYMFNIPMIDSAGKGTLDVVSELEALSSYISLDTVTQGKSDITIIDMWSITQDLNHKTTFYLSANNLRTTFSTSANSNVVKQEKLKRSTGNNVIHFYVVDNFALEITLRRMFATFDYTSNNNVNLDYFSTNGIHKVMAELDLVPLKSFKSKFDIDVKQPSSLGHIGFIRTINLAITSEKQTLSWIGKEEVASFIHSYSFALFNEESAARLDLSESMEGHLAFLKSTKLPAYQKSLWDVLKFDQVTSMDDLQVVNISSSIVYTKSMEGQEYAIPYKLFEDGVLFNIPGVTLAVPQIIKQIPGAIRKFDMRIEEVEIPDHITIPPVLSVPEFELPFTNLYIEPFSIDLKQLEIPKMIVTREYDIMLPGLPVMSVPSYEINMEYLQEKMSYLSIKIPQYDIQVSSFTLPKSVSVGDMTIDVDEIKSYISNFELPTIVIPEQKIEIPEIELYLPSSIFIPSFGALSATYKVVSPIYNVLTTAEVEKKDSNLLTSLNSVCTSTMVFLEYDLTGTATLGFNDDTVSLKGIVNFIHSDVNVKWQHTYSKTPRMKRQATSPDPYVSSHTLMVDVTSPLFSDVGFRYAARKDGITASMSSPTTGFLGLTLQRRSPSQLFGKLFIRYLATPEKDTDIITFKATLKNSQKLTLQSSFSVDTLRDMMEETKGKIPAITEAIVKVLNKYHIAHFGFDLNRGGMKIKNTVSNTVERAYHEFPLSLNELQVSVERFSDMGVDLYRKATNELMGFNFNDNVLGKLKQLERRVTMLISEDLRQYLDELKLTVPGSEEQISILELMNKVTDRVLDMFQRLLDFTSKVIDEIEFTIPGTEIFVSLKEILKQLEDLLAKLVTELKHAQRHWFEKLEEWVGHLGEGQEFIDHLNDKNKEIAPKIEEILVKIKELSKEQTGKASGFIVEVKDSTKELIHEIYISFNMNNINMGAKDFMDFLQSRLHSGLKTSIDALSKASERTAPHLKITGKRVEVDISLPFLWKSFSEWPMLPSQWYEISDSL